MRYLPICAGSAGASAIGSIGWVLTGGIRDGGRAGVARLTPAARQAVVAEVLAQGASFGSRKSTDERIVVEFVSANPTGPLHVGHGRQAALGDSICNLLETQGWQVTREFYYNDAGVQIEALTASVKARLDGLLPGDPAWPAAAYNGEYVADIADAFRARATVAADDRTTTA